MSIPETDWKKFKPLKDKALERICASILAQTKSIAADESRSMHERYMALFELISESDIKIAQVFDGHSRSKATMQLCQMTAMGLVTDEELQEFTEATRDVVQQFVRFRA